MRQEDELPVGLKQVLRVEEEGWIFIGSLLWQTEECKLEDAFSCFSKVVDAQVQHPAVERSFRLWMESYICSFVVSSVRLWWDVMRWPGGRKRNVVVQIGKVEGGSSPSV
jgi:hypothetical protein